MKTGTTTGRTRAVRSISGGRSEAPRSRGRRSPLFLGALFASLPIARCNCEDGEGIQRAAVELTLTFLEEDSCSGAVVPRRIPDDYEGARQAASTDFGSRAERRFEVRSTGTAPLTLSAIELSDPDPEFALAVFLSDGETPATLPMQILANRDQGALPGAIIEVSYGAQDAEADLVDLIVRTDDPKRGDVRFALSAGRGRVQVCGTTGCGGDAAIAFGNVSINEQSMETLTIKNVGEGDLDLHSIRLASASAEFCAREATELPQGTTSTECPLVPQCMVLKPGEEYLVNVRYTPRDGGEDTGVITIVSGDAGRGNVDVPIKGVGAGSAICPCVVDASGCTPASVVDFGSVDVGSQGERTVRLVSCGTEEVTLAEAALETASGPFFTGPEFQIVSAFSTGALVPGAHAEGVIAYRPTSGGSNHGGLRYVAAGAQSRSWLSLSGRAATCDLAVLPSSISFGTVASGSSADRIVTMVNNGARDCTVTAISDPANGFSLVNKPPLPHTIPSGQSYDLMVRYESPARATPQLDASSFDVTSNAPAPNQTTTVQLTANGGGSPICALEVQPTGNLTFPIPGRDGQLRFETVSIGYSKTLSIRVTNTGNTQCVLESYQLVTQAPGEFSASPSNPLPHTFGPQSTATIDVTFSPRGQGPAFGIPPGTYGGFSNYVDFAVSGQGLTKTTWSIAIKATPVVPSIDVIPDRIDFGLVTWQQPQPPDNRSSCGSTTRVVNVYNSGTGMLDVLSIAIDPTSDPVFLITRVTAGGTQQNAPYAFSLPPGSSASVELRFFPSRINPQAHSGLLIIENTVTGMGTPVTVPLTGGGTANSSQTDVFQQLSDNKVDILWVVDDSCSMEEEQTSLADNFQNFINFADSINVNYQVAVITTEINDAPAGKLWACGGYDKIIRASDPNRVQAFQCAANVTTPPGGNARPNPMGSDEAEAGLQAARLALDAPLRDNENAGFLRDDARLAVIIVSDEEDQSPGPINLYVDFFRNIKGFANPQLTTVSAIVGDVPNGCATAEAGQRYYDAVGQLNGQFQSVCSSSWTTLLMNIGLDVFALRQGWTLSRPAEQNTIVVRVDGTVVAMNATNGWTYDPATNTVTFHGSGVPGPGATIEVQYGVVCIP